MTYGINSPIGLVPHSYLNGQPYTGALSSFPIASNTVGNIFIGDPVILNNGNISVFLPSATPSPILGVFAGCKYQAYNNGELSIVRSPYWISGTQTFGNVPAEAMIVIADDQLLFDTQVSTSMTFAGMTLATTYTGAASGIIGQYLPLAIGITGSSASAGTAIPTNTVYYADGSPVQPNPTSGNLASGMSAFYADLGLTAQGNSGLGSTTASAVNCLQVVRLTERIDQVTYPNLWLGFASSACQNNNTTPPQVTQGSFNNVLVQINNRAI